MPSLRQKSDGMANTVQWRPRTPHDVAAARRDRGLQRLRRATAILAVTAVLSVGGASALAAITRPGHASPARTPSPAGADDSSGGTLRGPVAPPTAHHSRSSRHDGRSHASGNASHSSPSGGDGQSSQASSPTSTPAPQPAPQPQPQPAPPPPPVTSGGS